MSSAIVTISALRAIFKHRLMYQNTLINVHTAKKILWNIAVFAIIKVLRFCSASVEAGHSALRPLFQSSLTCIMAGLHEKAKVINFRLVEEITQSFNGESFLPYCKLYNKCIWKKEWIFYLNICIGFRFVADFNHVLLWEILHVVSFWQ